MLARLLGLPVEAKPTVPITPYANALGQGEPPAPEDVKAVLARIMVRQRILESRLQLQKRLPNGA